MAYRGSLEALQTRKVWLERELREIQEKARELSALATEEERIRRELSETHAHLETFGRGRKLPLLDTVQVASPCPAKWDDMIGDDRVRFCGSCAKNVYNLSALPQEDAERLLQEKSEMCVRFFRRADGTVLTADCPVGVKRKRVRRAISGVVGGGLLAVAGAHAMAASEAEKLPEVSELGGARDQLRPAIATEVLEQGLRLEPVPVHDVAPVVYESTGMRKPPAPKAPKRKVTRCIPGDPLCSDD